MILHKSVIDSFCMVHYFCHGRNNHENILKTQVKKKLTTKRLSNKAFFYVFSMIFVIIIMNSYFYIFN